MSFRDCPEAGLVISAAVAASVSLSATRENWTTARSSSLSESVTVAVSDPSATEKGALAGAESVTTKTSSDSIVSSSRSGIGSTTEEARAGRVKVVVSV